MLPFAIAVLLVLLRLLWQFIHLICAASSWPKLPPSPRALPIIGNLHMLGKLPHRILQQLAKKYGYIMSMRLGYVQTIIVSSPQAAERFLKTHDIIFANRPKFQAYKYLSYGAKAIAFMEYSSYWRNVRRVCTIKHFSTVKIDSFATMRKEELGLSVQSFKKSAAVGEVLNLSTEVGGLIEDMKYAMVLGRCKNRFNMKALIQEATRLSGTFNIADYVPWLGPLDLQGLIGRMKATSSSIDKILEEIIDEHEKEAIENQMHHNKDFTDVMLSLMNKPMSFHNYEQSFTMNRTNIKAIILDMLVGGIESTALIIEWALSELLKYPRVMRKLQEELKNVIGLNRMVEERDLAKLIYLDMVKKETLRLHVSPFLVPHESMEDIMINGYFIPKKTMVIINAWAIARDPTTWPDNADEFFPKRFMDNNIDVRGWDFQLIPFGSGRRGCPAMQLGLTTVRLVLAQLVHCFDWELPNGMLPIELDMSVKFGLTMPRAKNLFVVPTYRLHVENL